MTAPAELIASQASQPSSAIETRRDLPTELRRFISPDTDKILHELGERSRSLRQQTGHIMDHSEFFAGLAGLNPQISLGKNPIFNNEPHPYVDGHEWNLGAVLELKGFRFPLDPILRVVVLTPHAVDEIDPRVYATGNVKGEKIKEIITMFSQGVNVRVDEVLSQHRGFKAPSVLSPEPSV